MCTCERVSSICIFNLWISSIYYTYKYCIYIHTVYVYNIEYVHKQECVVRVYCFRGDFACAACIIYTTYAYCICGPFVNATYIISECVCSWVFCVYYIYHICMLYLWVSCIYYVYRMWSCVSLGPCEGVCLWVSVKVCVYGSLWRCVSMGLLDMPHVSYMCVCVCGSLVYATFSIFLRVCVWVSHSLFKFYLIVCLWIFCICCIFHICVCICGSLVYATCIIYVCVCLWSFLYAIYIIYKCVSM